MKALFLVPALFFVAISSFCQSATVTSDNKLLVNTTSDETIWTISKADFGKVKALVSKAGEVQSYAIAFMWNESYFSKKEQNNAMEQTIMDKILLTPTGTKIYFDEIKIKSYTDATITTTKCTFVLTD